MKKLILIALATAALCAVALTSHPAPAAACPDQPPGLSLAAEVPAAISAPASAQLTVTWSLALGGLLFLGAVRSIQDGALIQAVALPAAGASAVTGGIDLGTGPHVGLIEGRLSLPATPALVDTKTISVTIEDSADNITFAAVPELSALVITGAGGVGAAAALRDFRFPGGVRRYVRASAAVQAAGGSNVAVALSFSILA